MTVVSVVIPWRGGDPDRERNLAHVRGWYRRHHPGWEVVIADGGQTGPWCKATAVHAGIGRAAGRVIAVADADCITPNIGECAAVVEAAQAAWAVPHHAVYRLREEATAAVVGGVSLPDWRGPHVRLAAFVGEIHRAVIGGGVVVLDRSLWDTAPIDARFTGWGQEDLAWGWTLSRTHGLPRRMHGPCWHLWHRPQKRMTRTVGSADGQALWKRYSRAYTAAEVADLLAEPGAHPARTHKDPAHGGV